MIGARLRTPRASTLVAVLALALAPAAAGPAGAAETPPPQPSPAGAAADSSVVAPTAEAPAPPDSVAAPVDPYEAYLDELSRRREAEFDLEALSLSDADVDSLIKVWEQSGESPYEEPPPRWRRGFDFKSFRYNRVEGVNFLPGVRLSPPTERRITASGRVGYGWASELLVWRGALEAQLLRRWGDPTLEIAHARDVYSYGSGGFPGNSLAAALFGRDYDDYFLGEGTRIGLGFRPGRWVVDVAGLVEDQESMARETQWSLFERGEPFRDNPAVDDLRVSSAEGTLGWGNPARGRYAFRLTGRKAGEAFDGNAVFESASGRVVARRELWFGDLVTVGLRGGTLRGPAPWQDVHHLGGFETLRGYEINEIAARQFAHARLDYKLGTDVLGYLPWLRQLRLQAVPFFDAAAVFEKQARDGTAFRPEEPELKSAAGLGLQRNVLNLPGGVGELRVDLVRRLDRGEDPWVWRVMFTQQR